MIVDEEIVEVRRKMAKETKKMLGRGEKG